MRNRKFWTKEESEIVITHYPHKLTSDLLVFLPDRTVLGITGQASKLGIRKSAEFMKSPLSGRITKDNDIGAATRFYKQMPGWNKGKKQSDYMSAENIEKTKATRFKKGQDPHNTVLIGFERLSKDGYVEVKVRHLKNGNGINGNFELKHRLVYEKHFGPIPEGMIVELADGNKLNFEPSNLVLRTRKENLLNNTMCDTSVLKRFLGVREPELMNIIITEYPEVIELKRKTILLSQKINKHAKSS